MKDHANGDHIYGYDSVKPRSDMKSGAGLADNGTRRDAIITAVGTFNTARKTYLADV